MVAGIGLTAREYKLLLDPKAFKGRLSLRSANAFWTAHIVPVIETALGPDREHGLFEEDERRIVRYWDTPDGLLVGQDFTLRERLAAADKSKERARREITLKLRTPDLFLAAASNLPGARDFATKFEEDVAPLEVVAAGSNRVELASPPSIRSRFSLSTKQTVTTQGAFERLDRVLALYPTLERNLEAGGAQLPKARTALTPGFTVTESVCKGATVSLGKKVTGEFALTIWDFDAKAPRRRIAEISYKCPLPSGKSSATVARRALRLFLAMQERLGAFIDLSSTSKTALALGPRGPSRAPGMQHV